jgi:hypothetical protein
MDHSVEIMTILDSDGHLRSCHTFYREQCIKLIKDIHDGDYWHNEVDDVLDDMSETLKFDLTDGKLLTVEEKVWNEFINAMTQRGTMEVSNIFVNITTPIY